MNFSDAIDAVWQTILDITSLFVLPDWGALIGLLPVFVLIGLVGPYLTFVALGALVYQIRKPRTSVALVEGPRVAEIGPGGEPVFPAGLPYCRRDGLIYASGTTRCDRCREELAVVCPMCSLGRAAIVDTCTNCGLVLKVEPRAVVVTRQRGPKPGGAAVA